MQASPAYDNFKAQRWITAVGVALFVLKITAWYLTGSVAILTDALESVVNVVSGFIGLYGLYLSAQPKDHNHPYGHGKVEFVTAAIEGVLISLAGVLIVKEAILQLRNPHPLGSLDMGIGLVAFTAAANYAMGRLAVQKGKKSHSLALTATGEHLKSDFWSTAGLILGLLLIRITGLLWLDGAVALLFAAIILWTGYKIIRRSLAGIMDEADRELLDVFADFLQEKRAINWVDVHNLRVIKYGATLHVDCHLTVPWYFNVHEAHNEIDGLDHLVRDHFGDRVEMFVHTDGCLDFSCKICHKADCPARKHPFENQIVWTFDNLSRNNKHSIDMLST